MPDISEENQTSKIQFIIAFFDDFDEKANYLEELYNAKHRDEARILCSSYIDGLAAALYWPNDRNNFNYVRCLKEHSGKEIFSYIHPKMLVEALTKLAMRGNKWAVIQTKVSDKLLRTEKRLYREQEIVNELASVLEHSEVHDIKHELWRGTFAAIAYVRFRVASVHGFGPPDGTTFNGTTFQGRPVPDIDFLMMHNCLKKVLIVARGLSLETGKWFGHDFE